MPEKKCPRCGLLKNFQLFHRNSSRRDGLSTWCRECNKDDYLKKADSRRKSNNERYVINKDKYRARQREIRSSTSTHRDRERKRLSDRATRTPAEVLADRLRLRPDGVKRCRKCLDLLALEEFAPNISTADGLRSECRSCRRQQPSRLIKILDLGSRGLPPRCVYCSGPFEEVDHVMPSVLGGQDLSGNLVPSCRTCNRQKGATHPV